MFARLITDSVKRRPRRKMLTVAALALGMAVVTVALSVALDVGDRLAAEFTSLGANLVVTPQADSLPLEIGGVDYRLPKIKSVFWHNNIIAFTPMLDLRAEALPLSSHFWTDNVPVIGTWADRMVSLPGGGKFETGIAKTNPWWKIEGRWFSEDARECVVGATFARKNHISIGDPISLATGAITRIPSPHIVAGILTTGGPEDEAILVSLADAQFLAHQPGLYRKLYVLALTKPEDAFAHRDPKTMDQKDFERWSCTPYVSSIAYSLQEVLPGSDVRVIHRVADTEGQILTRVRSLLWLVTLAALLAAALAVGASSAASVIERRSELALMKALGAGSGMVGFLLAAEQLLLAFVGGTLGYAIGYILARIVGTKIFGAPPPPSFLVLSAVLGLAILVTVLGSARPLRRATRCEPAPILRGE